MLQKLREVRVPSCWRRGGRGFSGEIGFGLESGEDLVRNGTKKTAFYTDGSEAGKVRDVWGQRRVVSLLKLESWCSALGTGREREASTSLWKAP